MIWLEIVHSVFSENIVALSLILRRFAFAQHPPKNIVVLYPVSPKRNVSLEMRARSQILDISRIRRLDIYQ